MIFDHVNSAVLNNTCFDVSHCNVVFNAMCFVGIWGLGIYFSIIASLNVVERHLIAFHNCSNLCVISVHLVELNNLCFNNQL